MTKLISVNDLDQKFFELAKQKNIDLFLELGAYDASTSVKIKEMIPSCDVHAYEANIENFEKFNSGLSDINYHYNAISNYNGESEFFIQRKHRGVKINKDKSNSIRQRSDARYEYDKVVVNTYKIDSLDYVDHTNIALWVDVEGCGYEVLSGANNTLDNVSLMKVEVETIQHWKNQKLADDVIQFILDKGFQIPYRDQEYPEQYNLLCVK